MQEITPKGNESAISRNFTQDQRNNQSYDQQTDDNYQVVPNFGDQKPNDTLTIDARSQISKRDASIDGKSNISRFNKIFII